MSPVAVTLKLGHPGREDPIEQLESGVFSKFMEFLSEAGSINTWVLFNGTELDLKTVRTCERGGYGRVLGFNRYSSEKAILDKLGEPETVSISPTGTVKLINYPQWNASFQIQKGSVIRVCVTSLKGGTRYINEYGQEAPTDLKGDEK